MRCGVTHQRAFGLGWVRRETDGKRGSTSHSGKKGEWDDYRARDTLHASLLSLVTSDGSNKKSSQKGAARGRMIIFMILKSPDWLQESYFMRCFTVITSFHYLTKKGIYLDFYLTHSKFLVLLYFKSHFLFCDLRKRQILLSAVLSYMRQFPKERADVDICQHLHFGDSFVIHIFETVLVWHPVWH